jgi:hypothetical protein
MSRSSQGWRRIAVAGVAISILAGCGGSSATSSPTVAPTPTAGLFVDAGSNQGLVSRLVYGSNIGPSVTVGSEMLSQIHSANLTTVTFPGGSWGDENDIQFSQLDEFIAACGPFVEPRIVVRLRGGTAQKAADLVKYANVTKRYHVMYWGIGNEPDLYEANGLTGYNQDWRSFAQAMKAVDPSIKLVGPDLSQFSARPVTSYLESRTSWLLSFLHANSDLVDVVSVHRFPFPGEGGTAPTKDDLRANGKEWDNMVSVLREMALAETGRNLPVAVTAANSSSVPSLGGDAGLDSHFNAIWWADVLGRLIRQDPAMVGQFAFSGDWGILGPSGPRPMYYVYQMYSQFGDRLVRAVSDDSLVSIYASKHSYGILDLMIVNLGSTTQTKKLR